jgi:hypothetical protein
MSSRLLISIGVLPKMRMLRQEEKLKGKGVRRGERLYKFALVL